MSKPALTVLCSAALLVACADRPADDLTAPPAQFAHLVGPGHVLVEPTGDPNQDVANLSEALNSGYEVVELGPGTFVLNRPVEATDFTGTLTGAGVDQTTITAVTAEGSLFPLPSEVTGIPMRPALIRFTGVNQTDKVVVSNLTLTSDVFTEEWYYYTTLANFLAAAVFVQMQDAEFRNLRVVGVADSEFTGFGFSMRHGLTHNCWGDQGPTESTWKRIQVETVSNGLITWRCPNVTVTVGGKKGHGVDVSTGDAGIVVGLVGSALISHNTARSSGLGIGLRSVPYAEVSNNSTHSVWFERSTNGKISHNTIEQIPQSPGSAGVEVDGGVVEISRNTIHGAQRTDSDDCNMYGPVYVGGNPPAQAQILENDITLAEGSRDCHAILIHQGTGGMIRSNRLAGTPISSGIYFGYVDGWTLRDNNVNHLNACPDVYLSPSSSNNTVQGNRFTTVWDGGVGNVILGDGPHDCEKPRGIMKGWEDVEAASEKRFGPELMF